MVMSIKQLIRQMPNDRLARNVNKIRAESENQKVYGPNGSSKWVTTSAFWAGHHGDLKAELERRKRSGQISSTAGMQRSKPKPRNVFDFRF